MAQPQHTSLPQSQGQPEGPRQGTHRPAPRKREAAPSTSPQLNHATVGLFPTFGGSIAFRKILLLLAQVTAEPSGRDERVK